MQYYFHKETISRPYEKTIIECKAPTDASIKLYEEIKEKAYKSIIDTIEIKNNILNVSAIIYKELLSYNIICKYTLKLNDANINGKIEVKEYDKDDLYKKIVEAASKFIAIELINKIDSQEKICY